MNDKASGSNVDRANYWDELLKDRYGVHQMEEYTTMGKGKRSRKQVLPCANPFLLSYYIDICLLLFCYGVSIFFLVFYNECIQIHLVFFFLFYYSMVSLFCLLHFVTFFIRSATCFQFSRWPSNGECCILFLTNVCS